MHGIEHLFSWPARWYGSDPEMLLALPRINCCAGRSRGGQTRREQLGHEGYSEMGKKGGLSTNEESGGERAAREGVDIDESKFTTKS